MKYKFSYERFCEYVKSKMSVIVEDEDGEFVILEDTQPLQIFGFMTEEETLRYLYDNHQFDELDKVILQSSIPCSHYEKILKLFQEEHQNFKYWKDVRNDLFD